MSSQTRHNPSASGLDIDVIDHIQTLLRDQYEEDPDGLTLLKELIQNADDAEAISMGFGYSHGIREANHPLLQCPAFFIINNGPFDENNDKGIRKLGPSAKADDMDAIGRFGLGMKSIFHWCEAFVYLDSPGEFLQLVNPLGDEHGDWNLEWVEASNNAETALRKHFAMPIKKMSTRSSTDTWFLLWIPLRQKAHISDSRSIDQMIPGDKPKGIISAPTTARKLLVRQY